MKNLHWPIGSLCCCIIASILLYGCKSIVPETNTIEIHNGSDVFIYSQKIQSVVAIRPIAQRINLDSFELQYAYLSGTEFELGSLKGDGLVKFHGIVLFWSAHRDQTHGYLYLKAYPGGLGTPDDWVVLKRAESNSSVQIENSRQEETSFESAVIRGDLERLLDSQIKPIK